MNRKLTNRLLAISSGLLFQLTAHPQLVELSLAGDVSYSDLSAIADLTNLRSLSIPLAAGTDLTQLSPLTGLQTLNISGGYLTDLSGLPGFAKLETLSGTHNCLPVSMAAQPQVAALAASGVTVRYEPQRSEGC